MTDTSGMPVHQPSISDVRRSFAGSMRSEARTAAGSDDAIDDGESSSLRPVLKDAYDRLGSGPHSVDDVVDSVMSLATVGWGSVNQASGPGATRLSQAEIAALTRNNADLGAATAAAARAAFAKKNPVVVELSAGAPSGVTLAKHGDDFTISADASVAVGSAFSLVVDGNELPLQRGPAGITTETLVAPPGYGLEVVSRSVMTEPVQTATVRITKDDASWLKPAALARKAESGLRDFVKHTRIHDADWGEYFPTTWSGCVAQGVPAQISAFFTAADTQITRDKDSVTYVGRGPFQLYTEITVAKKDGAVTHALVEID